MWLIVGENRQQILKVCFTSDLIMHIKGINYKGHDTTSKYGSISVSYGTVLVQHVKYMPFPETLVIYVCVFTHAKACTGKDI